MPLATLTGAVGIEGAATVQSARGLASDTLRSDAKRIYVIVTDDAPRAVDELNFVDLIKNSKNAPTDAPVLFAFRGAQSRPPGCVVARVGTKYETLALATRGATFDICEPDWSPQFQKLVTQVIEFAKPTVDLNEKKITKVLEVKVDDVLMAPDSYKLESGIIHFKEGAIKKTAKKFRVVYERSE